MDKIEMPFPLFQIVINKLKRMPWEEIHELMVALDRDAKLIKPVERINKYKKKVVS